MNAPTSQACLARQAAHVSFGTPTADAWGASFLHQFDNALAQAFWPDHQQLADRACAMAQALFDARCRLLHNKPSHTVLGMCGLILSAYEVLRAQLASAEIAFALVQLSFRRAYQSFIDHVCMPLYLDPDYPADRLSKMNFDSWGRHDDSMARPASSYPLFFKELGEPGLSRIIHDADQAWIEAIAVPRRTRAGDARFCPFRFVARAATPQHPGAQRVYGLLVGTSRLGQVRRDDTRPSP